MFLLFTFPAFAQPATNTLPVLAPAYGQMPPTFWEQHGVAIIIGSLTVFVVVGLAVWKLLQPKPPVVVPPETAARRALAQLQGRPEDGKLLSEASQILRRYFSAAFQLPPGELTTAEFYAALAGNDKISVQLGDAISRFLRECDERKFSSAKESTPFNAVSRALELVSFAEVHRRSAPVPGAAMSPAQDAAGKQPAIKSSDVAASGDERTP